MNVRRAERSTASRLDGIFWNGEGKFTGKIWKVIETHSEKPVVSWPSVGA